MLDFDGVLSTNSVHILENGLESVTCSRFDGIGISKLKSIGIDVVIVSTEKNHVVRARAKKLKVRCIHGVEDKAIVVKQLISDANIDPKSAVFVGNDVNDLPALELVGNPVAVKNCWPEILPNVKVITNLDGGMGAVREICDKIYNDLTSKV
jgi:YrbI family 3-deoxy-D-manno-octulosonate 8-phosphate phosphatase